MYEALVARVRYHIQKANFMGLKEAESTLLLAEAADAIEELSAKAMPKKVGFSGWKGCRDTRYKCPLCAKFVRNDEKYCHKCGQALMFPIIGHTPYVPGKRQEVIISWPDEPPKEET